MHKRVFGAAAPFLLCIAGLAQTTPAAKSSSAGSAPQTAPKTSSVPPLPTPGGKQGPPPPAHPITAAQAREIMQLTGTDQIKNKLIENVMQYTQRAFPPFVPPDVKEDVRASLEKMDVDTPTIAIYQKYLSTEDAEKTIEFYKTPAGKDLLQATPTVMNEIQQAALKQGQQTFQTTMERHKTEIEAAQKTYEQQHPSSGSPTLGPPATPSTPGNSTAPRSTSPSGGPKSASPSTKPQ